jgi:hypothetical protein
VAARARRVVLEVLRGCADSWLVNLEHPYGMELDPADLQDLPYRSADPTGEIRSSPSAHAFTGAMTPQKSTKSLDWRKLRGRVTLSFAVMSSGLDERAFAREHVYRGRTDSRLFDKWRSDETALSRISAERLDRTLPGTADLFSLPLFELLSAEPLGVHRIRQLLQPYRAPSATSTFGPHWRLLRKSGSEGRSSYVYAYSEEDTHSLFESNSLDAFIIILGIVRMSEVGGNELKHRFALQDLFRSLPVVLRIPWFRVHAELLIKLIENVRSKVWSSVQMFDVDMEVIWRQADDPDHQPRLELRPTDPLTGRAINIQDPILHAEVVLGSEVRRKELMRRVRRKKASS